MKRLFQRAAAFVCAALVPVSYTHLDVYKRQPSRRARRTSSWLVMPRSTVTSTR